jgi:ubiquinone/menaquinone biosynthesis C-methylase UbiE
VASIDELRGIYDALGARYDRWTTLPDKAVFDRMRSALLGDAGGSVLEVAVGTGKNLRHYPATCRIVGLDLSEPMLAIARRRARETGRAFEGVCGDATALPYGDGEFDGVVCTLAGCTFPDPVRVFREMRRVCRPDGRAYFLEHVRPTQPWLARLAAAVEPFARTAVGCDPNRDTVALIARAGFEPRVEVRALGGLCLALSARP